MNQIQLHEKSFRHQEVPNSSIHHSVLVSLRVKVVKDRPIKFLICGVAVAVALADSKASHLCGRGGGLQKLSATQVVTILKARLVSPSSSHLPLYKQLTLVLFQLGGNAGPYTGSICPSQALATVALSASTPHVSSRNLG